MKTMREKIIDTLRSLPNVSWMARGFSQIPEDTDCFQRFQIADKTGYVAGHVDVWESGDLQVITVDRTASLADAISALASLDEGSVTLDWVQSMKSIAATKLFATGEYEINPAGWPTDPNAKWASFIAVFNESGILIQVFTRHEQWGLETHLRTPKNQVEFIQLLKVLDFDITASSGGK